MPPSATSDPGPGAAFHPHHYTEMKLSREPAVCEIVRALHNKRIRGRTTSPLRRLTKPIRADPPAGGGEEGTRVITHPESFRS